MECISKLSTSTDAPGSDEGRQTTDPGIHHTLLPVVDGDEKATKANLYADVLITLSIRKGSQLFKRQIEDYISDCLQIPKDGEQRKKISQYISSALQEFRDHDPPFTRMKKTEKNKYLHSLTEAGWKDLDAIVRGVSAGGLDAAGPSGADAEGAEWMPPRPDARPEEA